MAKGMPKNEAKLRAKWACKLGKDLKERADVRNCKDRQGITLFISRCVQVGWWDAVLSHHGVSEQSVGC